MNGICYLTGLASGQASMLMGIGLVMAHNTIENLIEYTLNVNSEGAIGEGVVLGGATALATGIVVTVYTGSKLLAESIISDKKYANEGAPQTPQLGTTGYRKPSVEDIIEAK